MKPKKYREFCAIERSSKPLTRTVKTDNLTDIANECFDLPFDGVCKFYPFKLPELPPYKILAVTGRSGSGKSTILKSIRTSKISRPMVQDEFVVVGFDNKSVGPDEFRYRTRLLGLDPDSIVLKKFGQLSEGEKFRAEVAMNLESDVIFDEFTSMVDRSVAETVSRGIRRIVLEEDLNNVVVCSCHKDFIEWVEPDAIVDLDDSKVYVRDTDGSETHEENTTEEKIGEITV